MTESENPSFSGVYSAVPTPFKRNQYNELVLDIHSFEKLCQFQIRNKIDGLVIGGTTGESPNLDRSELDRMIDMAKKVRADLNREVRIIVGVGTNSTKKTLENIRYFRDKCDAGLVVFPYYNKPNLKGLHAHLLEAAKLMPIIPYYVPGRTGQKFNSNDLVDIINDIHDQTKNVVAVKDASGDLQFNKYLIQNLRSNIACLTGDDFTYIDYLKSGGHGTVSVVSNIVPDFSKKIYDNKGKVSPFEEDKNLIFSKFLFSVTSPIPVKYVLKQYGIFEDNDLRLPLTKEDEILSKDYVAINKTGLRF